jgi:SAM-dependent methyltransferase
VIRYIVDGTKPFARACTASDAALRAVVSRAVDRTADIAASMSNHWILEPGHEPWRSRLGTIRVPTLVIHGTEDPCSPANTASLDVGSGAGQSTRDAARAALSGSTLGVDVSDAMLVRARRRTEEERLSNVSYELGDAQIHRFRPAHFDVVISRFGTMFFGDPVAAFANIARASPLGARLVSRVPSRSATRPRSRPRRGGLQRGRLCRDARTCLLRP